MQQPTQQHMVAARRVIRYLTGTSHLGLSYQPNNDSEDGSHDSELTITAYCDADWAGDTEDRRSTTGYCTFINGNLISWQSKKQVTVALSSAEAEYMAIADVVKEVEWMKELVEEMNYVVKKPMKMKSDNLSAGFMAKNEGEHDRTKHISTRYHFIKERISSKDIDIDWVPSEQQIADIFTKGLKRLLFNTHRDKLLTRITCTLTPAN
jgi:hypothetical protein